MPGQPAVRIPSVYPDAHPFSSHRRCLWNGGRPGLLLRGVETAGIRQEGQRGFFSGPARLM